jgi:uncharacterized membrane protein (UPF0127 family)
MNHLPVLILKNTQGQVLLPRLHVASRFKDRAIGLLGQQVLDSNSGLWIHSCNSIHTFFMKFSIDCIFVDRSMKIQKIACNVKPWRLLLPVWKSQTVIEVAAGTALQLKLKEGDTLNVSH